MKRKGISVPTVLMLLVVAIVATFVLAHYAAAKSYADRLGNITALEEKYAKLNEIAAIVDRYFVGDIDEEELLDSTLAGYVDGLGDKWSGYYNVEQTQSINESNDNDYVGIGVTFMLNEQNEYEITGINSKGPAFEAGFAVKDIIVGVNGVPASQLATTDDVVKAVTGEEGTSVNITVRREGKDIEFTVVRKRLFNECIEARVLNDNIGYVVITDFPTNADVEFREKVSALLKQDVRGLVFDVRMNGGGYVSVMSNMLDMILPEGIVITMVDKQGETKEYRSKEGKIDLPMAVITNEYSISAAEFFAAALQEYGVAKVVGDKTGGKGFAQSLFTLEDGSSVNLSIYRYYTPKGNSLAETGITPDIEVSLSEEDFKNFYYLTDEQDTQLQAALQYVASCIAGN